jgi:hypothetical protein
MNFALDWRPIISVSARSAAEADPSGGSMEF